MEENNEVGNTGKRKWVILGVVAVVVIVGAFLFFNMRGESEEITGEVVGEESFEEGAVLYVVTSPYKPYMYEEDGEYKGIAFEVLDRVMTNLGVEYKFELFPWTRAYKMGEEGMADAFLGASYREDREQVVRFSDVQRKLWKATSEGVIPENKIYSNLIEHVFFIRKIHEDTIVYESLDQIVEMGYRVGINKGYGYSPIILEAGINFTEYITLEAAFEALIDGEIDLYILNKAVGISTIKDLGILEEITYIEKPLDMVPAYILFTKKSDYPNVDELRQLVDEELIRIHESGEYDEIYRKYTG